MNQRRRRHLSVTCRQMPHLETGKGKFLLVLVMLCAVCLVAYNSYGQSESSKFKEYEVKAAFMYNFLKFTDFPSQKMAESNTEMIIGIIGKDPFGKAIGVIKNKKVKGRKVVIKLFKSFEELKKEDKPEFLSKIGWIKSCHLLFICSSEKKNFSEITDIVKNNNVLTVGEAKGFLEVGGVINFIMHENNVNFEINVIAAKKAKLQIRSQLLRLAEKVIDEGVQSEEN